MEHRRKRLTTVDVELCYLLEDGTGEAFKGVGNEGDTAATATYQHQSISAIGDLNLRLHSCDNDVLAI